MNSDAQVFGLMMNVCLGAVYAYSILLKPVRDDFEGISY